MEQDGLDDIIAEAERDGAGLRGALLLDNPEGDSLGDMEDEGEDLKVEELENMMAKMRAVKGTSFTNSFLFATCHIYAIGLLLDLLLLDLDDLVLKG